MKIKSMQLLLLTGIAFAMLTRSEAQNCTCAPNCNPNTTIATLGTSTPSIAVETACSPLVSGQACYYVAISNCPPTPNISAQVRVGDKAAGTTAKGTVALFSGLEGTTYWDAQWASATAAITSIRKAGYCTVQVA